MPKTACRTVTLTVATGATLLALTACSPEALVYEEPTHPAPTMHSLDAQRSVVEFVDASVGALGGEWETTRRPHQGVCSNSTYTETYGITWKYNVRRSDDGPSGAQRDITILEALWHARGLTTQRSESSSEDPLIRLVGRGDVIRSIGYQDSPFGGGITIGGESPCALDDAPGHADDDVPPTMTPPLEPASGAAGPAASG